MSVSKLLTKYPNIEKAMKKIMIFSPETYVHSLRVAEITAEILRQLNKDGKTSFSKEEAENIVIAAYIHDIGKLSVPQEILSKQGKLTDMEFEKIKQHPLSGYIRIKRLDLPQKLEKTCCDIAMLHHKKIDGSGYPQSVDKPVPYYAQIVQVADIYEALTGKRSYRKSLPHEKAISMMENGECGTLNKALVSMLDNNIKNIEQRISKDCIDIDVDSLYEAAFAFIPNASKNVRTQEQII